jgi:hypothetical protein
LKVYWLIGVTALVLAITAIWSRPHWWSRVSGANVTYAGEASPNSAIYRSSKGELLVVVNHGSESDLYVIEPSDKKIGIPNKSAFVFLPGLVYSKNIQPLYAPMGKADVGDPQLLVGSTSVEFTSAEKNRVRAAWQ